MVTPLSKGSITGLIMQSSNHFKGNSECIQPLTPLMGVKGIQHSTGLGPILSRLIFLQENQTTTLFVYITGNNLHVSCGLQGKQGMELCPW